MVKLTVTTLSQPPTAAPGIVATPDLLLLSNRVPPIVIEALSHIVCENVPAPTSFAKIVTTLSQPAAVLVTIESAK